MRMRGFAVAVILSLGVPVSAQASPEDSFVNATLMCRWLDSMEFVSGKCAVSAKASIVQVMIEAPVSEAGPICKTIASTMKADGVKFDRGWKLRIINPLTGNNKTAECRL